MSFLPTEMQLAVLGDTISTDPVIPEKNLMKKTILSATALALVLICGAVSQTAKSTNHHVVFQLTEPEGPAWGTLTTHVNNMRNAFARDGGAQVEVVFYGQGLNMLRKTNTAYEERLKQLTDEGVTLSACQNAMRVLNVKTEDLFPFASQVDSGIAQIVRRQEAGWSYIH
jgi:intracellular sulfur oxidation DsrE/DsrF family protein